MTICRSLRGLTDVAEVALVSGRYALFGLHFRRACDVVCSRDGDFCIPRVEEREEVAFVADSVCRDLDDCAADLVLGEYFFGVIRIVSDDEREKYKSGLEQYKFGVQLGAAIWGAVGVSLGAYLASDHFKSHDNRPAIRKALESLGFEPTNHAAPGAQLLLTVTDVSLRKLVKSYHRQSVEIDEHGNVTKLECNSQQQDNPSSQAGSIINGASSRPTA